MKRLIRLFPLLFALLMSACSDSTGPTAEPWLGTYTLHEVNGRALPAGLKAGFMYVTIKSGSLELRAGGRWSETLTLDFHFPDNLESVSETLHDGGTYTLSGASIRLVSSGGEVYTGTISDGVLTYAFNDEDVGFLSLTFRR